MESCQFFIVRDQACSIESNPFACVRTGFRGEPHQLFAPLVDSPRRFPTGSCQILFNRQKDALVLCQAKRLKRAQYPLFIDGLELACHNAFIVPVEP